MTYCQTGCFGFFFLKKRKGKHAVVNPIATQSVVHGERVRGRGAVGNCRTAKRLSTALGCGQGSYPRRARTGAVVVLPCPIRHKRFSGESSQSFQRKKSVLAPLLLDQTQAAFRRNLAEVSEENRALPSSRIPAQRSPALGNVVSSGVQSRTFKRST